MKKTQADRVLQYIHDFGNISTFDAFTDLGVTRLSARIFELRKRFDIKTEYKTSRNRYGESVTYAVYSFVENN